MKTIKNIAKSIKAWDKKNTNFHSSTYMLLFLTSSVTYLSWLQQTIASI